MNWFHSHLPARLIVLSLTLTARAQLSVPQASVVFTDVTQSVGLHWTHVNGATPEKYLIETMGGGAAFLDYNQDGLLDIFLVNSGCHKYSVNCTSPGNALYRQERDGTFTDVTREAGLAEAPNYG